MDESILRNLDTQSRMLDELQANIDATLAGQTSPLLPETAPAGTRLSYDALTHANDELRFRRNWAQIDLGAALTPARRDEFVLWLQHQRLPWSEEDFLVLGFAGAVGAAATFFDRTLDARVANAFNKTHDSQMFQGWDRAGKQLPIDYTGPGVGGPSHRLRSAGHDLARPLEALRQIRAGEFRGTAWTHGVKVPVVESLPHFRGVESWPAAMIVWAKHLAADIVTPMSLPLPGFSKLWEIDNHQIAQFAHAAYQGPGRPLGQGLNMRSGFITPSLAVLSTEAIIRSHMLIRTYQRDGQLSLEPAESALQNELLLAAHSLVGAASLGKSATTLLLTKNPAYAIRHLNVPVLTRIAMLSLATHGDMRARRSTAAPSWDGLLADWAEPWQLDSAQEVELNAKLTLEQI
ncbi:hypothetical protein [Mycolicibacterium sp. CR10]|uniref:hypothetical protein n=1 Tax=Mycolicibacterium sp. CR10 TaxID=2562314 RepID=UPI0010BFD12F|nr:hypothetical protein [Mycolicibacterium sp. CR10]